MFFLVALPIIHWIASPALACRLSRSWFMNAHAFCSFVDVLAPGVFFTGMIKDFFCLPRPLSPPLQRITMSGSTALEYGFPSTHSANAVSVALYCLTLLHTPNEDLSSVSKVALEFLAWLYAGCVVIGRMYCGMHGFLGMRICS
jgi:membrane-associated phospholipid phosphatase